MPVTAEEALRQLGLWAQVRGQPTQDEIRRAEMAARQAEIERRLAEARRQRAVDWNRMPARANMLRKLIVPRNARNHITGEPIAEDNVVVNFSSLNPANRASKKGQYYKEQTVKEFARDPVTMVPIDRRTGERLYNLERLQVKYQEELPTLRVPAGSINAIMMNEDDPIKDGNILVNFRGNEDDSYESKYGRFYRESTIPQLQNMHPQTRGAIVEPIRKIARIIPEPGRGVAAGPAARRRRAATRKSRRKNRKSRRNERK